MNLKTRILLILPFFIFLIHCESKPHHSQDFYIIHFNDVYDFEPTPKDGPGGAVRAAAVIKSQAQLNPLILFGGDALGGSSLSYFFKGAHMTDVLAQMGVQYAVCGNHEFDEGLELSQKTFEDSSFTWLCSNVRVHGKPLAGTKDYRVIDWQGVKVGLMGIAGNWLTAINVGPDAGMQSLDGIETAKKIVTQMKKEGAQVIVALTHMNVTDDALLMKSVPEIDLIVGGHEHGGINQRVEGRLIWKAAMNWRELGLIKVTLKPDRKVVVQEQSLPVPFSTEPDPSLSATVQKYLGKFNEIFGREIGVTTVDLDLVQEHVRRQPTNFGNFVADVLKESTQADVAFMNGGGLRSDQNFKKGPLKFKDVLSFMPFQNYVVTLSLTGAQILAVLERSFSFLPEQSGGYLQYAGLKVWMNPNKAAGQRVQRVTVNGVSLDLKKSYSVTTNDFIAEGGNGYVEFKAVSQIKEGKEGDLVSSVVAKAIQNQKMIGPQLDQRLVILP